MTSRERALLALEHKAGDRIPVDFWATAAVAQRLEAELGLSYTEFLDRYDVDLRYIEGPTYVGPPLADGTDIWGVTRSTVPAGTGAGECYSEVTQAPLGSVESVEEILAYGHWPDADLFDYSLIEAQCDAIRREERVVVFMGDRLNRVAQLKPAMYLRGTENILVDLAVRPDIARTIFLKIREFYLGYLERILAAANGKIDMVLTGDDFGAQHGLLISIGMWREFIRPGFSAYIDVVKQHGAVAMHHTCGSVPELIPDMVDCGLNVLQSVQPEAAGMSLVELKERFGNQICFQGGISIQKTMPYGSPEDVRREVRAIAGTVKPDGGYIFCTSHNIQADTPTKNIIALVEAYHDYGNYGET
jgi:uroporphyrinogen decarboxylase